MTDSPWLTICCCWILLAALNGLLIAPLYRPRTGASHTRRGS